LGSTEIPDTVAAGAARRGATVPVAAGAASSSEHPDHPRIRSNGITADGRTAGP
jgi:hypothetical protein